MTTVMTKGTKQVRQVSKGQLKARMLQIFRELEADGGELVVTDRGRPVLRIVTISRTGTMAEVFGPFQGKAVFHEDPDVPTADEWTET